MDSEAHRTPDELGERQTFRLAVAQRWTDEGGKLRGEATAVHDTPESLWEWVSEFTRPGKRTVMWCHNLDYDVQVTRAFYVLPKLGWTLIWSNLDSQVSMCKWTRGGATLVMADTFTWCPKPLKMLGDLLGIDKPALPEEEDTREAWITRCMSDVKITVALVKTILDFVRENELGNMQMSGAGMGYAMWRHKFLTSKILVHANPQAIEDERTAMHTGRAEAWKHGVYTNVRLTEWDLTNAYTRIARDSDLPRKLVRYDPAPTLGRYRIWRKEWRVLATVHVTTENPVVPVQHDGRETWPVGEFTTTLWDCEIDLALSEGASITPLKMWGYLKAPVMHDWASHTLNVLADPPPDVPSVMLVWYKHQARATIGRCGVRYAEWEHIGDDWIGITGLSLAGTHGQGDTHRLLHLGGQVYEESGKVEGRDSVPQLPSWIAAKCRVQLWQAMRAAGLGHVYYVDTDSVLVDDDGDARMEAFSREHPELGWRVKGRFHKVEIYGPRQIIVEDVPRISGVPKRAQRVGESRFEGEVWRRAAGGLTSQDAGAVRVDRRVWDIAWSDPRRTHLENGATAPIELGCVSTAGRDDG
jgi:hypothetical protein